MIHVCKQGGGDLITNIFLQKVVYRKHKAVGDASTTA